MAERPKRQRKTVTWPGFAPRARRVLSVVPYLGACTAIFYVSSMPRPPVPELLIFPHSDKVMHAVAYGLLAVLALWATLGLPRAHSPQVLRRHHRRSRTRYSRGMRNAFLLALCYGVLDECHQSFVPGRSASFADLVADGMGAALALALLHAWRIQALGHGEAGPTKSPPSVYG